MWSIAIDPGPYTTGAVRIPKTGHAPREHHNAKQYYDNIEDILEQADEVDKVYLQVFI